MRILCILFSLVTFLAAGQRKLELRELKGTFKEMRLGNYFAYEVLLIEVDDELRLFRIDPVYGQSIVTRLVPGMELTFKALVDDKSREVMKKMKDKNAVYWTSMFGEGIQSIYLDGTWIPTPGNPGNKIKRGFDWVVLLEQTPVDQFVEDGIRKGLSFQNGLIAFSSFTGVGKFTIRNVQIGKPVSFIGFESMVREEYLYPIENINRVVSFVELEKHTGKIESFIYKQNFARIGLKLNGKRYNFPAELATAFERFANDKPVTIYVHGENDVKTNLLPTIHAIVQGTDTLKIPSMYYGDPDGKHEHQETELTGKITQVNTANNGMIISLIVANDYYVEVDHRMATQLRDYLTKGKSIKISGLERIKKDGEIYERNYRIITPQILEINGKEFILNN